MRAIWSGAISFGLVNIPVKLNSAIESSEGLDFDMLSKKDTPRNARLFGWDRLLTDSACQPLWEAQTKSGQIR